MGTNSQLSIGPMEVQTLTRAREITDPSSGHEVSLTSLLVESVADVGLSDKEAALTQGYEPTYWSRIKSGERPAQLDRIGRLPEPAKREFAAKFGRSLGMRISEQDAEQQAAANLLQACARYIAERA